MTGRDQWAAWLLNHRQGGSEAEYDRMMAVLGPIRDRVLANAHIEDGHTVVDIGSGDGLIAFEALYYVGRAGRVIFSDVSQDLLNYCREEAHALGVADRCAFVKAGVTDLSPIEDANADAVTVRSVLVYVEDKQRAFDELFRVMAPGARLSLYEPIARFGWPEPPGTFWGFDVEPVADLAERVKAGFGFTADDPLHSFDERDVLRFAERAGFASVRMQFEATVVQPTDGTPGGAYTWESLVQSAPNPLAPTLADVLEGALSAEERQAFRTHVEPALRLGRRTERSAAVYLQAIKR